MRILLTTTVFLPRIGGVESMVDSLARGFLEAGHAVVVAAACAGEGDRALPYEVVRRPGALALRTLARRSDVVLQNGASLRLLLPVLAARRPVAVVHHTWLPEAGFAALRRWALGRTRNIAVSGAIAAHLPVPSRVIPNLHRSALFAQPPGKARRYDLCCVARLVSDKGVDLLLAAMAALAGRGLRPTLLLVGDGPERGALESQVAAEGQGVQVRFTGLLHDGELPAALADSRILVVPSRFREPFGIIALEGAASGCYLVGADGGGLAEAIGPCGETFARGSAEALAVSLERLLIQGPPELDRQAVERHLAAHRPERIAALYLEELRGLVEPGA